MPQVVVVPTGNEARSARRDCGGRRVRSKNTHGIVQARRDQAAVRLSATRRGDARPPASELEVRLPFAHRRWDPQAEGRQGREELRDPSTGRLQASTRRSPVPEKTEALGCDPSSACRHGAKSTRHATPNGFEFAPRSNARQQEQLGRADCTGAQDHFLASQERLRSRRWWCDTRCRWLRPSGRALEQHPRACAPVMIVRFGRCSTRLPGKHDRCSTACPAACWFAEAKRRRPHRRGRDHCSHRAECRLPSGSLTKSRAPGITGERTETPIGPSLLCAGASITISSLDANPSLFRKYGSTSA